MKTFETEKHNIPEGATHYFNEDHFNYFTWVAVDSFGNCWGLIEKSEVTGGIKPIPQTNTETLEEKEVEWINGDTVEYHNKHEGEGGILTFVGIHPTHKDHAVLYGKHLNGGYMSAPLSMLSKPETEAERVERERLENGQSLYELVQSLWCTVDSKYTPHPYGSPMVDDKTKEMYARLARAVDYRKESE